MAKSTILTDRSRNQPELPGARAEPSSTFIEAIRRTPCGSLAAKTWLMFLASYCRVLSGNPEGRCWPSQSTLARDSEGSARAVRRLNAQLVALGWLVVEHGAGKRCTYRVRSVDAVIARPAGIVRSDRPESSGLRRTERERRENTPP